MCFCKEYLEILKIFNEQNKHVSMASLHKPGCYYFSPYPIWSTIPPTCTCNINNLNMWTIT